MAIFESIKNSDAVAFLRRLQQAWQTASTPDPSKLTPDSNATEPPAPLQAATGNPEAPAPDLSDADRTYWLDLASRPPERDTFSTAIGSGVISPTMHKLMQQQQSGDVAQRFAFCNQLKILYENDYTVSTCIDERIAGACRLGVKQEVIPADGQEDNPAAKESVDRANLAYRPVAALYPTSERELALREFVLYGTCYDRLAWNRYGTVTDLMGLPCQTMKILVNSQLKLNDGQFVAYQQFDPFLWGQPSHSFADVQILCVRNRKFRSDVYGITFLLPIIKYVQDNIKAMDHVQRARGSGLPINVRQNEDAIGNPVHPSTLAKAKFDSLEERVRRGEVPDGYYTEWINGKGKMERLESTGGYWDGFNDNEIRYRAAAIAGLLGRSLALIISPDGLNRASAQYHTENDYDREHRLGMLWCDMHDVAMMHRAVFLTNLCAAVLDDRWDLKPGKYYIDPNLIKLKSDIVGQVTEDRAMERVQNAASAFKAGTMPAKEAAFITAQSFKRDPEQYWQLMLRENPSLRRAYPEDYVDPNAKTLPPQIASNPDQSDDSNNPEPEKVM